MSVLIVLGATAGSAQAVYTPEMVRDLPAGTNLFALIEAAQPEVTTDRFNSGGLNAGGRDRASGFLASWTQSQYLFGDSSIASPTDGMPMLVPSLALFGGVGVATTAGGLEVSLRPRLSHMTASRSIEAIGSAGVLAQSSSGRAPAITQLGSFTHVNGVASGSYGAGLEWTAGAVYTRATTYERAGRQIRNASSVFATGNYAFDSSSALLTTVVVQPEAWHVQSTYDHAGQWRVFGSHTTYTRDADPMPVFRQADRVFDGPIPSLIDSRTIEHRSNAGARVERRSRRHGWSGGLDGELYSSTIDRIPDSIVVERVDGVPARMWRYRGGTAVSHRHGVRLAAFGSDRITLSTRASLTIALTADAASASASGAQNGISWRTLLPSINLDWILGTPLQLEFKTGLSRYADRPLLEMLAYGDPNAPTANVYRWDAQTLGLPLVMRVGPGTGGDSAFSAIDRDLQRPVTDQFLLQLSAQPWRSFRLRVTGLAQRYSSLIGVVNTGAPIAAYNVFTISDANADWVNPKDDQQLAVYDRRPDTFGQDRYLLTNPDVEDATMGAIVVAAEVQRSNVLFRIGGTASASVGSGGSRGFTAIENDQAMVGELFTNPNAQTNARGRLFNDRAYTIKSLAIVRLPSAITIGALARFQDGQPFSRLAIVPGLNQGAEAIQAFPRGRSRFSYRATLDVRFQKSLNVGTSGLDLIADTYNLLNQSNEVEEYVVTGPRFRDITAVQPPRAFHLGARVTF